MRTLSTPTRNTKRQFVAMSAYSSSIRTGIPELLSQPISISAALIISSTVPREPRMRKNVAHMDEAIRQYTLALEKSDEADPTRQYALEQLAAIYRDVKSDFVTAEEYYLELIALAPESPERYYTLGDLYERFHEPERMPLLDKAIEAYQRPVEMNPEDPVAYRHVAAVLNRYGRFEETIQWLQSAKDARTTDAEGYYLIATHYWDKVYRDPDLTTDQRREFTALGIDELDAALALNTEYVDAMVYKGLLLREQAKLGAQRRDEGGARDGS